MKLLRRAAYALVTGMITFGLLLGLSAPANAAWMEWYNNPGTAAVLACKKAVNSGFGPLWEINLVAASSPDYAVSATFEVRRGSSLVSRVNLNARQGAWDVRTTYASRILGDTFYLSYGVGQISTGYGLGQGLEGPISFSQMRYC